MLTNCNSVSTRDIHDEAPGDRVEVMGCDWRREGGSMYIEWSGWDPGWLAGSVHFCSFGLLIDDVHKVGAPLPLPVFALIGIIESTQPCLRLH